MTQAKREQAMVGLFVLVAAALLVGTVFALGGMSSRPGEDLSRLFPICRRGRTRDRRALFGRAESRPRRKVGHRSS